MGQVIELCPARAPDTPTPYRCGRCGTALWNLYADGRVRCADCEQECPLRTVRDDGQRNHLSEHANHRE